MTTEKKFTFDIFAFMQYHRRDHMWKYEAICLNSPVHIINGAECWAWNVYRRSLVALAKDICDYLRISTTGKMNHLKQDDFLLLNLPSDKTEFKGYFWDYFSRSLCEFAPVEPLKQNEFDELGMIIASEFPSVWGLPERLYSMIPTQEEEERKFSLMLGKGIEWAVGVLMERGVHINLPLLPNLLLETYRKRN